MYANRDSEEGFSLIELMTVIGIIAILTAVMLPNFLGAKRPAQDRQAQGLLKNGATAVRMVSVDLVAPTAAGLAAAEPALDIVSAATPAASNARSVSVEGGTAGGDWYLVMASGSTSGRCFAVMERPSYATSFQRVTSATCQADQFDPAVGWSEAW